MTPSNPPTDRSRSAWPHRPATRLAVVLVAGLALLVGLFAAPGAATAQTTFGTSLRKVTAEPNVGD